jgi:hypothetical protein
MPTVPQMLDRTSNIPRLSWVGAKVRKNSQGGRKGISGHRQEWDRATIDNGARTFAIEVEKVLSASAEESKDLEQRNLQGSQN